MHFTILEFPTIPRYYTALAQWLNCMVYILLFREQWRYRTLRTAAVCILGLAVLTAELMLTDHLPAILWPAGMAGAAALMLLLLRRCLSVSALHAGYLLPVAFMWSELAASLAWQVYYYYAAYVTGSYHDLTALLTVLLVYTLQLLTAWAINRRYAGSGRVADARPRDVWTSAVVTVAFFIISNLSFIIPDSPFTSSYAAEIFNLRTWVDVGAIAVLYAMFLQKQEMYAHYEKEAIESTLQLQYAQYLSSRESMELINRKYHDIKHQIAVIRAESDPERRSQWLDSIEENISIYDRHYQTGSAVLDTLLTSKSALCQEKGVQLTCVADGALLSFMDAMDLCAVFGNALDNAVEAASEAADPERRLIHLSVSREKSFVLIRCENYYEGERELNDGIPRSTKGDDAYHGFGVKSIRRTAAKYGGTMSITAAEHWFDLKVLLPLPSADR